MILTFDKDGAGGESFLQCVDMYPAYRPLPIQIGIQWGHEATTELYIEHIASASICNSDTRC